jgi:hypothetical protein
MNTNKIIVFVSAVSFLVILCGCEKSVGPSGSVVYSNSFETSRDTVGWGPTIIRNDASPGGGKHSMYVSGGCVVPHAQFKIGDVSKAGNYAIRTWGKNLGNGGMVGLGFSPSPFASTASVEVVVQDSVWTSYQSVALNCPAGATLWIWMISGGYVWSAMLVDEIQVVRVN